MVRDAVGGVKVKVLMLWASCWSDSECLMVDRWAK